MRNRMLVLVTAGLWGSLGGCTCLQPGLNGESSSSSGTMGTQSSSALIADSSTGGNVSLTSSSSIASSLVSSSSSLASSSSAEPSSSSEMVSSSSEMMASSSSMMAIRTELDEPGYSPHCAKSANGDAIVSWLAVESVDTRAAHAAHYSPTEGWLLPPGPLSPALTDLRPPRTAIDGQGRGVVVYSQEMTRFSAYLSRRVPGMGFTPSTEISSIMDNDVMAGTPLVLDDGTAMVPLLLGGDPAPTRAILPVDATGMLGTQIVMGTSMFNENGRQAPQIAIHASGHGIAAWNMSINSGQARVHVSIRAPDGTWSMPEVIDDANGPFFAVGINSQGEAILVYRNTNPSVRVMTRPLGGPWTAPEQILGLNGIVFGSIDDSGAAMAVTDARTTMSPSGNGREYLFARRPQTGSWSMRERFALDDPTDTTTPLAAFDARPDGRAILAFATTSTGGNRQLAIVRYDPEGGGWGMPQTVGPESLGGIYAPCVSWRGSSVLVAWEDQDATSTPTVRARLVP